MEKKKVFLFKNLFQIFRRFRPPGRAAVSTTCFWGMAAVDFHSVEIDFYHSLWAAVSLRSKNNIPLKRGWKCCCSSSTEKPGILFVKILRILRLFGKLGRYKTVPLF